MRLVVQRVKTASVKVNKKVIGKIEKGLMVLLGISVDDSKDKIDWLVRKLINLRIFEDEKGKMNLSVLDVKGKILLVSQFTLYGNIQRGNRPDFLKAARPDKAKELYEIFIKKLSEQIEVQTGEFGADMDVELINNGPVTIIIEK